MTKRKKTVGEEAHKRLENPDTKQGIIDTQREMDKEYFGEIDKCIENHKHWKEPFYIVVQCKKEQKMENVIRRYFIGRLSMPTPQWDQTLWRYSPSSGDLRFVWVLPDQETAKWMAMNPQTLKEEHRELLCFVLDFLDHKLYSFYHNLFHKEGKECDLSESCYSDLHLQVAQGLSDSSAEEQSKSKILLP